MQFFYWFILCRRTWMRHVDVIVGAAACIQSTVCICYLFIVACVPTGWQEPRGTVYPADGIASHPAAKNHKAGRSSGEEPRRGGDPAAGCSGPRLRSCRTTRFGLKNRGIDENRAKKITHWGICFLDIMDDDCKTDSNRHKGEAVRERGMIRKRMSTLLWWFIKIYSSEMQCM